MLANPSTKLSMLTALSLPQDTLSETVRVLGPMCIVDLWLWSKGM